MLSTAFLAGQRIPVINVVKFLSQFDQPHTFMICDSTSCSVVVFWQFCGAILIVLGLIAI